MNVDNLTPEEIQQMNQEGVEKLLDKLDSNRKAGLEQLQRAFDQQEGRQMLDPVLENTIRSLELAVQGALTLGESLDSLIQMMRFDFVGMIKNQQMLQNSMMTIGNQHAVALALLKEKGFISDEEMVEKWKQLNEEAKTDDDKSPQQTLLEHN